MSEEIGTPASFYEAVGGEEAFTRLVRRFYEEVAADPVLRPVYPTKDLGPAEEHLRLFLIQYWGGPPTYNELRGHPRLRMRHVRFRIGETERDLWLKHMRTALDELSLPAAYDAQLWDYLVMAAHSLVNAVPEDTPAPGGRGDLGITPRLGRPASTPGRYWRTKLSTGKKITPIATSPLLTRRCVRQARRPPETGTSPGR